MLRFYIGNCLHQKYYANKVINCIVVFRKFQRLFFIRTPFAKLVPNLSRGRQYFPVQLIAEHLNRIYQVVLVHASARTHDSEMPYSKIKDKPEIFNMYKK